MSHLSSAPFGLDIDESAILYWGARGPFYTYSPEFTQWEALPGYYYAFIGWVTGLPRLGPTLLSLAELALLGMVAKRAMGLRAAWVAVALLAVSPWHLFYSRIVGTCVGAGLWILLGIYWAKRPLLSLLTLTLGLLHYTALRLFFVREVFLRLRARDWKALGFAGLGLVLALVVVMLSASSLGQFFDRGSYNLLRPQLHWVANSLGAIGIAVLPILPQFMHTTAHFMADYVHGGFAQVLPLWSSPLGWGTSLLFVFGLCQLRHSKPIRREGLFVGFALLALAPLGPSYSRFLFLVPLFCLVSAFGWSRLPARLQNSLFLFPVLLASAIPSAVTWDHLHQSLPLDPFFHGRHRAISLYIQDHIPDSTPSNTIALVGFGHQSARYWQSHKENYTVLPPLPADKLIPHLAYLSDGLPQHLLVETIPERADSLSGYAKTQPFEELIRGLLSVAIVETDEPILFEEQPVGRHLVVRWAFEMR